MILCGNPLAQYQALRAEIDAAVASVLANGRYILGPEVAEFEREFAAYCEVKHAIGVGSGTEALHLALAALDLAPGDEVITTPHTAVATVSAIELAGAVPVLADIDPQTYALDLASVEAAITERTRVLIPVHIYGQAMDLDAVMALAAKHSLTVIEDCAQAHGARDRGRRVGSVGALGCFSFYPTKNLGAIGDGGAVVTNDEALAARIRSLREYGWQKLRYVSEEPGWNSRLDEIQAAILRVKLRHLDADNARRRALADRYDAGLAGLPVQIPYRRDKAEHVFHLYVIATDERDALQAYLMEQGVGALIHYPVPVHEQTGYLGRLKGGDRLPVVEGVAKRILSLPMYPQLTDAEQDHVIAAVGGFFGGKG